jgi:hypothetical protein
MAPRLILISTLIVVLSPAFAQSNVTLHFENNSLEVAQLWVDDFYGTQRVVDGDTVIPLASLSRPVTLGPDGLIHVTFRPKSGDGQHCQTGEIVGPASDLAPLPVLIGPHSLC